tara:strand:+ start:230 stop:547 length:318 start_codon:yes stop_codon:yes gene_type:complete
MGKGVGRVIKSRCREKRETGVGIKSRKRKERDGEGIRKREEKEAVNKKSEKKSRTRWRRRIERAEGEQFVPSRVEAAKAHIESPNKGHLIIDDQYLREVDNWNNS